MHYDIFDSPLGKLTVATDGVNVIELHIEGDRYFNEVPPEWTHDSEHLLLRQVRKQLNEYFAGTREFFDVPLSLRGTPFQQSVWQAVQDIPAGTTDSYGEIARKIGKPDAVRAVGTAIGRNPICIIIPCHRVLAASGSLGGYVAGLERKQQLLNLEQS